MLLFPIIEFTLCGLGGDGDEDFAADGGGERGEEAIVVAGRDRVVFVIVTSGASDGGPSIAVPVVASMSSRAS